MTGKKSIKKRPSRLAKAHPSDSREMLLQAAIQVIAQKGFEGATVKDVADQAGVNVSLVSYHFGGKEGLYKTCLETFGQSRLQVAERVLQNPLTIEDFGLRLKLFAEDFIDVHLSQPDICKIVHRGMETFDPITEAVFKSIFMRIYLSLCLFIEAAQKIGFCGQNWIRISRRAFYLARSCTQSNPMICVAQLVSQP
jgi:AcrR family transcriptional regulator